MLICSLTQKLEGLTVDSDTLYRLTRSYYHDVVESEVVLGNITKDDHVLCIGGGACPISAILFHQLSGARVTVIDNNECCVLKARQIVDKLGLCDYVQVVCQDGGSRGLPFADYTAVHFAMQVSPLGRVFPYIEELVAPGTRLLVRRPKKRLHRLYDRLPGSLLRGCPLVSHRQGKNIGCTLLYTKQENSRAVA